MQNKANLQYVGQALNCLDNSSVTCIDGAEPTVSEVVQSVCKRISDEVTIQGDGTCQGEFQARSRSCENPSFRQSGDVSTANLLENVSPLPWCVGLRPGTPQAEKESSALQLGIAEDQTWANLNSCDVVFQIPPPPTHTHFLLEGYCVHYDDLPLSGKPAKVIISPGLAFIVMKCDGLTHWHPASGDWTPSVSAWTLWPLAQRHQQWPPDQWQHVVMRRGDNVSLGITWFLSHWSQSTHLRWVWCFSDCNCAAICPHIMAHRLWAGPDCFVPGEITVRFGTQSFCFTLVVQQEIAQGEGQWFTARWFSVVAMGFPHR